MTAHPTTTAAGATTVRVPKPAEIAGLGAAHAVVEASAGTGKTYVLEHLVIDLLLERRCDLSEILVVTFTEKATAELIHRVRAKIASLADIGPGHPSALRTGETSAAVWVIDEPARERLRRALRSFDSAAISTIHGFCNRLLVDYAFLQQRLFRQEAVDERLAFHGAFIESLRRDVAGSAALAPILDAHLGAGRSVESLEAMLFDCHRELVCLHPRRDGALRPGAFDQQALATARARLAAIAARAEQVKRALTAAGVHSSTVRWLHAKLVALAEVAALQGDNLPALLSGVDDLGTAKSNPVFDYWREKCGAIVAAPSAPPLLAEALAALDAVDAAAPPLTALLAHRLLPLVTGRLRAHKLESGVFDFQDMLTVVAGALDDGAPHARTLLRELRGRYRYALIDEFQDTDEVQWHIFRRIFFEAPDGHVLTVIGDPKQAIYGFRGADVHTYARARHEIKAAGGRCLSLRTNFRSSDPLLRALNLFLDQSASPEAFFRGSGHIHYDHPVTCGRPDLALVDGAGREQPALILLDAQPEPPLTAADLRLWRLKRALKDAMVDEIRALVSGGEGEGEGKGLALRERDVTRPLGPRDIMILTRTFRESQEAGAALRAAGIPFAFFKQERLFQTMEAREVLDLLRAIADPEDRTARARAFITAFFGLGLPDLAACDELSPRDPRLRLLHEWRHLAEAGQFAKMLASIVEYSGIVRRETFLRASERALTNYLHLIEILQQDAARGRMTVRELAQTFGAYVAGTRRPPGQSGDVQRLETDAAAVQIMTIHHAKGLEAPVVFLFGGFWPGGMGKEVRALHDDTGHRVVRVGRQSAEERQRYDTEQQDEERRVLYVALTRARVRLYLPKYPAALKLRGSYRHVNDRLTELCTGFVDEGTRALFTARPVPCRAAEPLAADPVSAALATWRPPAALTSEPSVDPWFASTAHARAGFVMTSYSAIKRRQQRGAALATAPDLRIVDAGAPLTGAREAPDTHDPRDAVGADAVPLAPGELSRGRLSGIFLHEVLEHVSLADLAPRPSFDAWRARPEVAALFEGARRRHDRHPAHVAHAQRLVHTALTAPVRLGEVTILGLASAPRTARELEFLYPIPELDHPLLGAGHSLPAGADDPDGRRWPIGRGLVKGFIDLLFEHDGRLYVCDWKGDWLPSWEPDQIEAHAQTNYALQTRLYTLAALRLATIENQPDFERGFGGVVFCFLRGMRAAGPSDEPRPGSPGVYFSRPSWRDVLAWQDAMLGNGFWGWA